MAITTKSELEKVQSSAPAPVYRPLSEDQVDDLIYFARNGQVEEFQASLITIAEFSGSSPLSTIAVAFDQESGNSPLHMASANGHIGNNRSATLLLTRPRYSICCGMKGLPNQSFGMIIGILNYLASLVADPSTPQSLRSAILNLQNRSGNTALHWAALNGHLEAVKILVASGANSSVKNKAGFDAVYEAEINSKGDVVEWLLKEGNLDEEAANDDDDEEDDHDATLQDGNERKHSDDKTMRGPPPSLEESISSTNNHDKYGCHEMEEKVEKLRLG